MGGGGEVSRRVTASATGRFGGRARRGGGRARAVFRFPRKKGGGIFSVVRSRKVCVMRDEWIHNFSICTLGWVPLVFPVGVCRLAPSMRTACLPTTVGLTRGALWFADGSDGVTEAWEATRPREPPGNVGRSPDRDG